MADDASQALLAQAKFLIERKRYDHALQLLTQGLGLDPDFHDLYCQLAETLVELGRTADALKAAEGAIRANPTAACGHQRRSMESRGRF